MNGWDLIKLGDAATFINGYAFKPLDWSDHGREIIRIQNLTKSSSEINYFTGEIDPKYKVSKGDLLISWSATLGIYEWEGEDAWLNQHIFKVVFDKKEFNKSFFKHLISQSLRQMQSQVHGATMQHITKKKFDAIKIPLPPLETQKKIAEIIDAADTLRQKTKTLIEKYDQLTQSLFLDMFGDPVSNLKNWPTHPLKNLAQFKSGGTPPRSNPHYFKGNIPWITTVALGEKKINQDNAAEYITMEAIQNSATNLIPKGSIMIGTRVGVGKASIIECDMCSSQDIVSLINIDKTINKIFMLEIFSYYNEFFKSQKRGATIQGITSDTIKNLKIISPPLPLQNQFAERVQAIEEQKAKAQAALEKSEELFQSLLQRAFKGELNA